MVTLNVTISKGAGTIPKDIELNSILLLDVSDNEYSTAEWDILSTPKNTKAIFQFPNKSLTKFGPLDKTGVYLITVLLDRYGLNKRSKTYSISVPGTISPIPLPPAPEYLPQGGAVMNYSFELPGAFPGWALQWNTVDDANVLATGAGVTRGRIKPTNFIPPRGEYAMCLGDDIGATASFNVGQEFSVSQEIDLTGMSVLKLSLKFRK